MCIQNQKHTWSLWGFHMRNLWDQALYRANVEGFHSELVPYSNHFPGYLRDGLFTVLSPREAVTKLRISKFVKPPCSSNTEIAPDVLIAAEIQFLDCSRAGLKTLQGNILNGYALQRKSKYSKGSLHSSKK